MKVSSQFFPFCLIIDHLWLIYNIDNWGQYIFFVLLMLTRLVGKITIRIICYNNLLAIFHEPTLEVEIQTNYYFEPQGKKQMAFYERYI